ncbi:hypothetical protein ABKN59_001623 [Abortiporus biennis]
MADSFADLWNTTAQTKQPEAPRKLGSSSTTNSRSTTPSYTGSTPSLVSQPKTVQKSTSNGGDAFSSLLSPSFSSGANTANMTIAQRAAQVEKLRATQAPSRQTESSNPSSAWAGLDSLGSTSFSAASSTQSATPVQEDDWMSSFNTPAPVKPVTQPRAQSTLPSQLQNSKPKPPPLEEDWGLNDFVSKGEPVRPASKKPAGSLWELDDIVSPSTAGLTPATGDALLSRSDSPGRDFDFGNRENVVFDTRSDDEDDILGDLSKPVDMIRRPSQSPSPQPSQQLSNGRKSRPVSPPPHIIGQIVEMGFSPQQARVALASTDTGLDVQAALDALLSSGAASDTSPIEHTPPRRRQQRERFADHDVSPDRSHHHRETRGDGRIGETPSPDTAQRNIQEQADKLLAQASEIGLTMFNRANAFWNQSKEKVQKAYEERAAAKAAAGSSGPSRSSSSRPKWMQQESDHEHDDAWGAHENGGFKDDDNGVHDDVLPPHPDERENRRPVQPAKAPVQRDPEHPSIASRLKTGNLFSDDPPAVYVSKFRHKTSSRSQIHSSATPVSAARSTPPRVPSPVQLIQRKCVSASASSIAVSAKHKAAGTEMFKLGRYAEAETSYTSALTSLPDSHLLLVPLYNNRALTRIKTGDHSGAIEDCTTVISIIGTSYHPSKEAKVIAEEEGASVDLGDALIKAYKRRAEAYEGKEKWDLARKDWEAIAGADWAGKFRKDALNGIGRCRKMLNAGSEAQTTSGSGSGSGTSTPAAPPRPKPRPKPKPIRRGPTPPSEALNRVREATQAAEAEDQAKHELKDVVDAKLLAWKGGKETNIRALIASLETVLWPELGWQKVGMHELVSPNQVKIRYTKAIAKLHPDKLNVNNTTLEQRMIANGVFGALNEAWNSFKQ